MLRSNSKQWSSVTEVHVDWREMQWLTGSEEKRYTAAVRDANAAAAAGGGGGDDGADGCWWTAEWQRNWQHVAPPAAVKPFTSVGHHR